MAHPANEYLGAREKGGREDCDSPILHRHLKSPSIPLYKRGKQNLVPWDFAPALLNEDTVSSAE